MLPDTPRYQQIISEMSLVETLPAFLFMGMVLIALYHWTLHRPRKRHFQLKQRADRFRIDLPLFISTPVTQEFSVRTFDVSLSGAFIRYEDLQASMSFASLLGRRSGIREGDLIDIRVMTGRFSQFQCQARVVRMNLDGQNPYPKGIGIEFLNLSSRKQRSLTSLIERMCTDLAS